VTVRRTYSARKHLLIIDITLNPGHEMLDVFGGRHFGWALEVLTVLPEVLESIIMSIFAWLNQVYRCIYSSVAFISGQVCGEQNSVIEP